MVVEAAFTDVGDALDRLVRASVAENRASGTWRSTRSSTFSPRTDGRSSRHGAATGSSSTRSKRGRVTVAGKCGRPPPRIPCKWRWS
jgi:hypothetical protein